MTCALKCNLSTFRLIRASLCGCSVGAFATVAAAVADGAAATGGTTGAEGGVVQALGGYLEAEWVSQVLDGGSPRVVDAGFECHLGLKAFARQGVYAAVLDELCACLDKAECDVVAFALV